MKPNKVSLFLSILEATPGFEPGIRVLQTRALPLGYIAINILYDTYKKIVPIEIKNICLSEFKQM